MHYLHKLNIYQWKEQRCQFFLNVCPYAVESDINAFYCQRYIQTTSPYPFIGGECHYYGHIAKCIGPGVSQLYGPWTLDPGPRGSKWGKHVWKEGPFLGVHVP